MDDTFGTYRNGHVELNSPVDWPEGATIRLSPASSDPSEVEDFGMEESEWPTTPEGIAALVARMDSREPLELTPDEERKWNEGLAWLDEVSKNDMRKQMGL